MFVPEELDKKNTYKPNLKDIRESALRTYGEAEVFYEEQKVYMDYLEKKLEKDELTDPALIYDRCHAIASNLAECCEMYLKAIYIYEHNIQGVQVDEIWSILKSKDYDTDKNGNRIYERDDKTVTFTKYDEYGNIMLDVHGKPIYTDLNGNLYDENNRGRKITRDGHYLDRLIELLSPESRMILETRMLTIPMRGTTNSPNVSILDVLHNKGFIEKENDMSSDEYEGWILKHRRTFEDARYSGQMDTDVSVEFLFHLATQMRAVAQYVIDPNENQRFDITDEELEELPTDIKQFAQEHSNLISAPLLKLLTSNNSEYKDRLFAFIKDNYMTSLESISSKDFYNMIKLMSSSEIRYISYLCWTAKNYSFIRESNPSDIGDYNSAKLYKLAGSLFLSNFNSDRIVKFLIGIKMLTKNSVVLGSEQFYKLMEQVGFEFINASSMNNNHIYKEYNVLKDIKIDNINRKY